jgi:hypothetical protein
LWQMKVLSKSNRWNLTTHLKRQEFGHVPFLNVSIFFPSHENLYYFEGRTIGLDYQALW